jgi:hypothetical protein
MKVKKRKLKMENGKEKTKGITQRHRVRGEEERKAKRARFIVPLQSG